MNRLKINIPDGFVVDKFDEQTGEVSFKLKPKKVTERIKNFDDVLAELGIEKESFLKGIQDISPDEVAYRKIKLIVKAFNEGWTPDWTNSNEYKYYPWFEMGSPSGSGFRFYVYGFWNTFSYVGSRLCFKSSELAKHVGNLFIDDYRDFLTLNIE